MIIEIHVADETAERFDSSDKALGIAMKEPKIYQKYVLVQFTADSFSSVQ